MKRALISLEIRYNQIFIQNNGEGVTARKVSALLMVDRQRSMQYMLHPGESKRVAIVDNLARPDHELDFEIVGGNVYLENDLPGTHPMRVRFQDSSGAPIQFDLDSGAKRQLLVVRLPDNNLVE